MISPAMAVAAVSPIRLERSVQAREARLPRVVALVIDTIIFSVILNVANAVFGVTHVTWGSPVQAYFGTATEVPWAWSAAIYVLYFAVFEATFSATPGKFLAGARVVSVDDRPLTVSRVLARNVLRIVDSLPLLYLAGGLLVLVTRNSQRLGDLVGATTVVHRRNALQPAATRRAGYLARGVFFAVLAAVFAFTAFFEYFGRPPLVIQGLYNERQFVFRDVTSYALGRPTWASGKVT